MLVMSTTNTPRGLSPRVRGTSVREVTWIAFEGLSPRVRGNLKEGADDWYNGGSIPACAGEPAWWLAVHGM